MAKLPDMSALAQMNALFGGGAAPGLASSPMIETPSFGSNPGALRMLSYAPKGLPPKAPLVVVLHGCTQDAAANAAGAGWLQLADLYGFAVLAPDQSAQNNPNRCFNWFQPQDVTRGQGEAESIRQMVQALVVRQDLDPKRIFVTGLSAGGGMASALLAAYPELFAGGGIIAGLPHGAASSMPEAFTAMFQGVSRAPRQWGDLVRGAGGKGPWPRVAVWHGDMDTTVKPSNAEAVILQWADVHGLPAGPTRSSTQGRRRRDVWLSAAGDPVLELNTISGLGHGSPIATAGPEGFGSGGAFLLEAGVSSSLELLRFWGVAEAGAVRHSSPSPPPRQPPSDVRPAKPMGKPAIDVQAIIAKALGAAGLLK
jgi:poly(hydroxyalkanoate) depolymerase family esterase